MKYWVLCLGGTACMYKGGTHKAARGFGMGVGALSWRTEKRERKILKRK